MQSKSEWETKLLGRGAFGVVTLYTNIRTNEQLVVKETKDENLSEKMRERWKLECEKMTELSHINIVKGLQLPQSLRHINTGSCPVLTMEYCNMYDLRRRITTSSNICGMEENQVKMIASDVTQAVTYLHQNNIFHRDLKPENIVLNKRPGERLIYKVTDLGYAKEISDTSSCYSYVGTAQYLAPELSDRNHSYNGKVDYWSLATTLFECTTGFRAFDPIIHEHNLREVIRRKRDEDIYVTKDGSHLEFHQNLPSSRRLSSVTKDKLEEWFRLMLRFDPAERGGSYDSTTNTIECFPLLRDILNMKILTIFKPQSLQTQTYDVCNQNHLRMCKRDLISMHEPNEYAFFINNKGEVPTEDLASNSSCLDYSVNQNEDDEKNCLYHFIDGESIPIHSLTLSPRSSLYINALRHELNKVDTLGKQKIASKYLSYYAYEQLQTTSKLSDALKALILYYKDQKGLVRKMKEQMSVLVALRDYILTGIKYDMMKMEELETRGINTKIQEFKNSQLRFEECQKILEITSALKECSALENAIVGSDINHLFKENVARVEKNYQNTVSLETSLQRIPHDMTDKTDARPDLQECLKTCDAAYADLLNLNSNFIQKVVKYSRQSTMANMLNVSLNDDFNQWQKANSNLHHAMIVKEINNNNNSNNNNNNNSNNNNNNNSKNATNPDVYLNNGKSKSQHERDVNNNDVSTSSCEESNIDSNEDVNLTELCLQSMKMIRKVEKFLKL